MDRRAFLQTAAAGLVTLPVLAETTISSLSELGGLKLGLVGLGERGLFLLDHFQKHCPVAAVCDVHHGRLQSGAAKGSHRIQPFSDYRQLLADSSLTGVAIATPDHWHARIALDALHAGKHVFCETPVCRTLSETAALVSAAKNSKLKTQAGKKVKPRTTKVIGCYIPEEQDRHPACL